MSPKGYTPGRMYLVPLSKVEPDPEQPRKCLDQEALQVLTESVKQHNVLEPIIVRWGGDEKFVIVSGERRYRASLAAGLDTIPAIFTTGDPYEISMVENLLRQGYTAIEEAEAIEKLRTLKKYQLSDLARVVGKAESTICEILSLVKLPESVKKECRDDHKAPMGILAEIAKQRTEEKMDALYQKYKAKGLTRGEVRANRTSLKDQAAQTAALRAAAKAAEEAVVDLSFVSTFAKRLDALDLDQLSGAKGDALLVDLVAARLVVNATMRALKARPQPAEQQPTQQQAQPDQPQSPSATP